MRWRSLAVVMIHSDRMSPPAVLCHPCLCPQASELPTDVDFKWAQDSYNATQRTVDTWVFFSVFRTRSWLLDQKWSYVGGFTGEGACIG
jgi:hypothetical protein